MTIRSIDDWFQQEVVVLEPLGLHSDGSVAEEPIESSKVSACPVNHHVEDHHATPNTDGALANGSPPSAATPNGEAEESAPKAESVFKLTVRLPHPPGETHVVVSSQEQVQDIRQSIIDTPYTFQYSCFHLEHRGKRLNDVSELSEFPEIASDPECTLVEDPYTESQARMHVLRVRELIGAAGNRVDFVTGIDAGTSLCDHAEQSGNGGGADEGSPMAHYDLSAPGSASALMPPLRDPAPATIKSLALSPWNPPPHHLRMRGHLLYLQITTNEGEQFYITSHVSGFYVNRSTNNKFDPTPRSSPKSASAHSLIGLLDQISPSFDASFRRLQEYNVQREPISSCPISNAFPAAPWLVAPMHQHSHQPDPARTQESFLIMGPESSENLRDWNEEIQSTRELPTETMQDKVFRERLLNKLFAEYNEAAVRGACLVARGEVQPLNPTEARDAQIFVHNNVFYSFGADGVGTFAADGGDEAARVATGKDVLGVKAANQLDISGLFTTATVVVDYLGKRVVGQSIVPGIFKQREPGEHQIDYGGVEGKEFIATNEAFAPPFRQLSTALRVKRHPVWDKDNQRHELEASVETKGLMGTDGRKYALDLYRLTPLDIAWLETHRQSTQDEEKRYPHRMSVLRPELVESYRLLKMREYISKELEKKRAQEQGLSNGAQPSTAPGDQPNGLLGSGGAHEQPLTNGVNGEKEDELVTQSIPDDQPAALFDSDADNSKPAVNGSGGEEKSVDAASLSTAENNSDHPLTNGTGTHEKHDDVVKQATPEAVDVSGFSFLLNPDVFTGQQPQTAEDAEEWEKDELQVRAVCEYLTAEVLPKLVRDLQEGDVGFPMDGQSLVREMHRRGINVRYLGDMARLCAENENRRLQALRQLCHQEMVARAFKYVCNKLLRSLPPCLAPCCISHLLNCLLGADLNDAPQPDTDEELKLLYIGVPADYEQESPQTIREEVRRQISLRYRYDLEGPLVQGGKHWQLLREVSLKLGFQLESKEYQFAKSPSPDESTNPEETNSSESLTVPQPNGVSQNGEGGKKKKKKHADRSPNRASAPSPTRPLQTFHPDNICNVVPVIKDATPRSALAEETLDAGRMSIQQDQKELGQELLLESLTLHEQIYGLLHPEVARVYYALSTLYYGLNDKPVAVELAKKAVIISERTLGVDNAETILAYLNLSLVEHATGNTRRALSYVRHALDLGKMVYGTRHPDSITSINNAGVMLQSLRHFHESRLWFEASLDVCEELAGKQSIHTATLLFQLAQALALDHDSKSAVTRMRESYSIFKNELGPENQNTKEAEMWLETLTHSAVSLAKQANALQHRKLITRNGRPARVSMGTRPQPPVGQSTVDAAEWRPGRGATGVVQRSVDELLRYINGDNKQLTPKKKTAHPKKRSAQATAV